MMHFDFVHTPTIRFGPGIIKDVAGIVTECGRKRLVVITGGSSFRGTPQWDALMAECKQKDLEVRDYSVSGEPSPELVDSITAEVKEFEPHCILSIGGGSVIDTGKAVSAMVPVDEGVKTFLEGVGTKPPPGNKVFFIAVPTTAGTGSEATKNAVISSTGVKGFKKSLRHDNYVPDIAVIDPELTLACPPDITAASGLDAITQLLEGFVSMKASPLTDSLAIGGLAAAGSAFPYAVERGDRDVEARGNMAYAACMSGGVLANAGLGIVHGMAGYLGGKYPIPHGVACGTLLAKATEVIIDRLFDLEEENNIPLLKYGEAAKYMTGQDAGSLENNCTLLIDTLYLWTEKYEIPRLSSFGITEEDCKDVAANAGRKNTPVPLSDEDCFTICSHCL